MQFSAEDAAEFSQGVPGALRSGIDIFGKDKGDRTSTGDAGCGARIYLVLQVS